MDAPSQLRAGEASSRELLETCLREQFREHWEALARMVEQEPDLLILEEIYLGAIAWAQREILRRRIARGELPVQLPTGEPAKTPTDECPPGDAGVHRDQYDPRIAWCLGQRIYLGEDTQRSRLFWLLATPLGRAHSLWDVQRVVDGVETHRDHDETGEEFRKAGQRVRKAIRDADADTHLLIVAGGDRANPEYTMVPRYGAG